MRLCLLDVGTKAIFYGDYMTYLMDAKQRKATRATLFFEFQKGVFHGKHWVNDSVYLYADIFDRLDMYHLFVASLPHFEYYYVTEVSPAQYAHLKNKAMACGGEIAAIFHELDIWVTECFKTESCFTILGI
jgi:hypothetical protein